MTVNNVNALLSYTAAKTDQAGLKQEEAAADGFSKVMAKVNDTMGSLKTELAGNAAASNRTMGPVSTVKKESSAQNTEQRVTSDSGKAEDTMRQNGKLVKNTEAGAGTETEQNTEEVEKAAEELVQDIAKEMDVTPEEVEEAMANLGLTAVELFDLDNLKQLLLTISGSTDELSLLTDETLYGNLQNLIDAVGQSFASLQEELGLSEDELNALVEQMISENAESDVLDSALTQGTDMKDMPEAVPEGMKDYTVSVHKDGETVQMKVTVDDESGTKSIKESVTGTPREEVQVSHKMRDRNASADSGRQEGNSAGNAFLQSLEKQVEVNDTPAPVNTGYQSAQTQEIMNQIMDYMRINLKADTQEMELQLHPASLGTVNVQIAAKDGAITAQFTTQNETVRAVIETQLIQLKEQFEEQGIKVDAVEVTVANHEYGQQFSQDNGNTEQKQGKTSKSTRRINLDEIGEEGEIEQMEESERIAVEMMQANGNTVDYTA